MNDSPHVLKARLGWVKLYEETGNASFVCRRCGISRPTLRKWWTRCQAEGEAGLRSRSRRPHNIKRKVTDEHVEWIRHLRLERKLGPKRIQAELVRLHGLHLAASTIWTVLRRNGWRYLKRPKGPAHPKLYAKEVPGDRVQIDTAKVGKGLFQYTATDDCTRMRVLALYPKRDAATSVHFLRDHLLKEFPFPIQRIQTDRGGEFFGMDFQVALMQEKIRFRPIRPYSPHLNGKVERSQRTDRMEFYATADLEAPDLADQLKEWQRFYNEVRPHGGIGGRSPAAQYRRAADRVPTRSAVAEAYDPSQEGNLRVRDHAIDKEIWPPS
jgi:transposase InsO family protein